jgi:hypothetical protein
VYQDYSVLGRCQVSEEHAASACSEKWCQSAELRGVASQRTVIMMTGLIPASVTAVLCGRVYGGPVRYSLTGTVQFMLGDGYGTVYVGWAGTVQLMLGDRYGRVDNWPIRTKIKIFLSTLTVRVDPKYLTCCICPWFLTALPVVQTV